MITIDGAQGEGGGQVVRSSLTLALATGHAVTIENVRAGRKNPGLMRQHLASVRAAAEISSAEVQGDALGSSRIVFAPGEVKPGEYRFAIGTAGSASLVLQTVLPALAISSGPSQLTLEGGTHNPWAPPFDFLDRAYLPLLGRLGPLAEARLERPGFYPAGGGKMTVRVQPTEKLARLELLDRGALKQRRVRALLSHLPKHIGQRECRALSELSGWKDDCFHVEVVDAQGPGNVVLIELDFEHVGEVFCGFGSKGVPAERVARRAWGEAKAYLDSAAAVGEHLADQLMLPLGIGVYLGGEGGEFRTTPLSSHSRTQIDVLRAFLELQIDVFSDHPGFCTVRVH